MTVTILYFFILISLIRFLLFLISNYFSIKMYGGKRSADMASLDYDKKRARIQHASVAFLQAGEIVSDLCLKIVATEEKNNQYGLYYVVLATDGVDFIQIEAINKNAVALLSKIGREDVGKCFRFTGIEVKRAIVEFNYGSTNLALDFRTETHAEQIFVSSTAFPELHALNAQTAFYMFLKMRHLMDITTMKIDSLQDASTLQTGEVDKCLKFKLDKLLPMRRVNMKNSPMKPQVFEMQVTVLNQTAKFVAWNIEAYFLSRFFHGVQGQSFVCKNMLFKSGVYGAQFTFIRKSEILLLNANQDSVENLPSTLQQLVNLMKEDTSSGHYQINIPIQIIDGPTQFDQDYRVCAVTDFQHKAQLFMPSSLQFECGDQFNLIHVNVQFLESGLLNLRMPTEGAFVQHLYNNAPILPANLLGTLPSKRDFVYPSRSA